MASTLSRRKGLGAPRRNNGAGSSGPTPFSARESMSHTNGAPRGTGVWGTGRLERSLPSSHRHSTMPSSSHHHQHHQQPLQHNNYNASSAKDGHKAACRDRWINTSRTMMGERAEVAMSSGCIYEGVIHVLTPSGPAPGGSRGMYQVIMRAARVKSGGDRINSNANIDHRGGTLVLAGEDIVSISVKRFPMQQHAAQRPSGLGTDADIGSRAGGNGGNRAGERRLQKVDTSWVSGTEDLSLKGGAGKWDQFAANERLFNVKSTFDENLYTTPLDKTSLSRKQMADAERIAAEIESKSSNNIHIREERNMLTEQDRAMGEEERFGGVLGTGGLSHQSKSMSSSSGTNGGTGRDVSGPRYCSPRDRGVPYSAVAVSNAGDGGGGGGGTGVYVPPALRPPGSGGKGGASLAAHNERGSAPSGSVKQTQGQSAAEVEAAARSEEAKEAAKAQLMDVLDGKLRSTSPKGANSSLKTGGGLDDTPAAAVAVIQAPSAASTPKKNPAKPGSVATPPLTSETVVATPSPPAATKTTEAAAAPVVKDAPVGKAAGSSGRKVVSTNAPPFVPAAKRVPASASLATIRPAAVASSASKPPPAVSKPPLATPTLTAKTGGVLEKKKSSLRASAREWKPNAAAPEWKPAASYAPTASPAIAPTISPASTQVSILQTPTQAQAPVAARMASPSPRGGGGGAGFGVGGRGVNSGGSVGFGGGGDRGGEQGHVSHMHQHVYPQQQPYHPYSHHQQQQQPSNHTHGAGGIAQQQQQVPQHIPPPPPQQLTSPHSSRHTSPHASPHSSQHRQQPHQQQPQHQHGSQHQHGTQQQQQQQQPAQVHHQAQQPQQSQPQHPSQHRPQQPQQQTPPQQQPQQHQHQTLPGGSLLPAGSSVVQGGATQMVVSSYPSGSVPAQIAAGPGVGGGAPHHMGAVPPHLMGGSPHGPMQPQQYPQAMYRTPSMGHHPQQMYMQPPPAGMRMPMAPGQLQGYPQQGMHMMGQPGSTMPSPGSPFFHGQMQMAQQPQQQQQSQLQLPPPQVSVQQGQSQQQQQQPRSFPMLQGHPGTGPAPGPPHTPPQPQRPGMMGMGGGVHGGGRMGGGNSPHDHGGDGGQGDDMVSGGHSRRGRGGRGSRGGGLSRQNSASRKHRGGSSG